MCDSDLIVGLKNIGKVLGGKDVRTVTRILDMYGIPYFRITRTGRYHVLRRAIQLWAVKMSENV